MPRVLLRSHALTDFQPIGEQGKPVYLSAPQIREMLRLRNKVNVAESLAILQMNEAGDRIDWYAEKEGDVIPWSAASQMERDSALAQLEYLHKELDELSLQMKESPKEENLFFASLLDKTKQFPDSSHIYLVDGKPVVTFWGFLHNLEKVRYSPLDILKVPSIAPQTSEIAPQSVIDTVPIQPDVQNKTDIPWRWLLLGLLLLLLLAALFFLLRSCKPPVVTVPDLISEPSNTLTKPSLQEVPLPVVPLPVVPLPEVSDPLNKLVLPMFELPQLIYPNVSFDAGKITLPDFSIGLPEISLPEMFLPNLHSSGLQDNTMENTQNIGEGNIPQALDTMVAEEMIADEINNMLEATAEVTADPINSELQNSEPIEPPEQSGDEGNIETPTAVQNKPLSGNSVELEIPANSAQNTSFLNGAWKATGGIQDAKTGRPLSLTYEFTEGLGQVEILRSDGSVCRAKVKADFHGNALGINNQSSAECDDGTMYQLPDIQCTQSQQGKAQCEGKYQGSNAFPIQMKGQSN